MTLKKHSFLCCCLSLSLASILGVIWQHPLQAQVRHTAAYYYTMAQKAEKIKDYRRAIDLYRRALESNPRHSASHIGAAETYTILSDFSQAEKSYQNVLRYSPQNQTARTGLAKVSIRMGKLKRAYKLLSAVQKQDPADVENNYILGMWHTKKEHAELAQRYFNKVLRLEPSHVPSLLEIARLLIVQQRFAQAREYLQRAKAIEPASADSYQIRGYLDMQLALAQPDSQGRLDRLASAYTSLLIAQKLAPHNTDISRQLIHIDIYRQHYEKAAVRIDELRKDRRLARDANLQYLSALLRLQISKGKDPGARAFAIRDLHRALKLEPNNALIRQSLENTILAHRHRKGLVTEPLRLELARYHFKEAKYYQSQFRRDRMQSHLNRSLQLDPFSKKALNLHLTLLKEKNDHEGMLFVYQQLRKLDPQKLRLRHRLEQSLRRRDQNIAYREKLFNPIQSTQKASFRRTPARIFVFGIRAEQSFAEYPDAPEQIARALSLELEQPGPVQAIREAKRARLLAYIRTADQASALDNAWSVHYRPEYISYIHDAFPGSQKIHYLISGTYRRTPTGSIQAKIELRESNTGTRLYQFRLRTDARNTLQQLAAKVRERILKRVNIWGEIIKVKAQNIFVNLGSYDGVKSQSRYMVPGLSKEVILKVKEVGAYVSRAVPLKPFKTKRLEQGHRVLLLKAKKKK